MGIKIELTDDNLPEVAQEIEIREDEAADLMKNQQAECDGMLGDACLILETHEDGSVAIYPGKQGCICLHSEKEAEDFCELIIRHLRHLPTFLRNPS